MNQSNLNEILSKQADIPNNVGKVNVEVLIKYLISEEIYKLWARFSDDTVIYDQRITLYWYH